MLNEETKEKAKEALLKGKKMSEEEIDNLLNCGLEDDNLLNNTGLWALLIITFLMLTNQPSKVVNINMGDK